MNRLQGKVAVIFGSGGGIGSATARLFAREGASLALGDLGGSAGADARLLDEHDAIYAQTDATVRSSVGALVSVAVARWGRIDILVNNAGRPCRGSLLDVDEATFEHVFDTNVKSMYLTCQAVLPQMLAQRYGSIINMSSNGGIVGRANDPVYCASKHAVVGLTKSIALAYATYNIRVNTVCPGPIDTPMLRQGLNSDEEFVERMPALLGSCPAGRCGDASEVASVALFLASDDSSFVNGAAIPIDGGKAAGIMTNDRYNWKPALPTQWTGHPAK